MSLSTGFASLDAATGGFPRGRIVEIFGASGSGKTTFALHIVAHLQQERRRGGVDRRGARIRSGIRGATRGRGGADAGGAAGIGGAGAGDRAPTGRSAAVDLLVIDSAAALTPEIELQTGIGKSGAGAQSRAMASGLRKLCMALRGSGAAVLFLNQTRAREEAEIAAGGPPLKLFAAMRISLRAGADGRTRFRVLKNKGARGVRGG